MKKIKNKYKRQSFLGTLDHQPGFTEKYVEKIDRHQQSSKEIASLLVSHGAPVDCYVISAHPEIDRKTLPLAEAVEEVVGFYDGTVIICIPNKLAYWEGEGLRERYILTKS